MGLFDVNEPRHLGKLPEKKQNHAVFVSLGSLPLASDTEYVLIGLFFSAKLLLYLYPWRPGWCLIITASPLFAVKPLDVFSDTKVMILLAGLSLASHYIVKAGTLHCCK